MSLNFNELESVITLTHPREINYETLCHLHDRLTHFENQLDFSPNRLHDLSGVEEFQIQFNEINYVSSRWRNVPLKNPVKAAFVAPRTIQLGYARMFQTLNQNPRVEIQIFLSTDYAWAWLKTPPLPSFQPQST